MTLGSPFVWVLSKGFLAFFIYPNITKNATRKSSVFLCALAYTIVLAVAILFYSCYAVYSNNKVFCIFIPSCVADFFGTGIIGIGVKKFIGA